MKNLVKVLFAAFVLVAVSMSAKAQATANVQATASVVTNVSVTQNQGLGFGSVAVGGTVTVTTKNSNAGKATITKAASTNVQITITAPENLTKGSDNLPFSGLTYELKDGTAAATTDGTTYTVPITAASGSYGDSFLLYLGGSVVAGSSQATGTYNGNIKIDVAYN